MWLGQRRPLRARASNDISRATPATAGIGVRSGAACSPELVLAEIFKGSWRSFGRNFTSASYYGGTEFALMLLMLLDSCSLLGIAI